MTTSERAADFVAACINQAEAEGYQQLEDVGDGELAPDEWGMLTDTKLMFRYGDKQVFVIFYPAEKGK